MNLTEIKQHFKVCKDLSTDKSSYLGMLKFKNIDQNYVANLPQHIYEDLVQSYLIPTTWQLLIKAEHDRKN